MSDLAAASDLGMHAPLGAPGTTGRSIGQAAARSGVSAKMIRYYEKIGLVRPAARSGANYRSFDDADVQALRFIARARSLGFSMHEVARLLELWHAPDRASSEVKQMALAHVAELDARIAALQAMKDTIEALAERCRGDAGPDCAIIGALADGAPAQPRTARRRSRG